MSDTKGAGANRLDWALKIHTHSTFGKYSNVHWL